jgi:hypothetical protein
MHKREPGYYWVKSAGGTRLPDGEWEVARWTVSTHQTLDVSPTHPYPSPDDTYTTCVHTEWTVINCDEWFDDDAWAVIGERLMSPDEVKPA